MRLKVVTVLVAVVCIFIVGFGKVFYTNKIEAQAVEDQKQYNKFEKEEAAKDKKRVEQLKAEKNENLIKWLQYRSTQKDKITLSVLGSSVTAGSGASDSSHRWANLLTNYLEIDVDDINPINLVNNGYGGYSTSELINDKKIDEVVKNKPDVVIFELCLLNNFGEKVSLEKTTQDINYIMETLSKELPDSLIVIQTANSIPNKNANGIGLTYDDYNKYAEQYVQSKGWNFINTYEQFDDEVINKELNYNDILNDGIHPTDKGYAIWYNILKNEVNKTAIKQ
ncbi:SGNH/GDSL hydrolase family protein [Priestia sp. JV24]|uniref:SGNH/GDSL hydrolase family protein n=1 Tax=Priestia sp. JV24 TaxID=2981605 RepID=UPI002220DBB5|nr:SGNH/GDSL hydrolase family protein [Priestia sp. JV24]MCU7712485.1 SGNH/GDSL hydrolase family protein [Priestia megaterium]MCW1046314.1 SGNH/GDSL hydrolase family protein [Priestia sp. JV24]